MKTTTTTPAHRDADYRRGFLDGVSAAMEAVYDAQIGPCHAIGWEHAVSEWQRRADPQEFLPPAPGDVEPCPCWKPPVISATRELTEPHRLERLKRAQEAAMRYTGGRHFYAVAQLHDHKGDLEVTWHRSPMAAEAAAWALAWEQQGEPGTNVKHIICGRKGVPA